MTNETDTAVKENVRPASNSAYAGHYLRGPNSGGTSDSLFWRAAVIVLAIHTIVSAFTSRPCCCADRESEETEETSTRSPDPSPQTSQSDATAIEESIPERRKVFAFR